jgi:hypothetical protein
MRKRRWQLALLAVVGCALLGAAAWLLLRPDPPSSKITTAAAERIEPGMTEAEAEAAIGLPPGDYRTDPAGPRHFAEFVPQKGVRLLEWEADGCNIQVKVDERSGRVLTKIAGEPYTPPTFWQRARAWLGL